MAVLIPNMKLPENCWECPCFRQDNVNGVYAYQCNVALNSALQMSDTDGEELVDELLYRFCPLKEVIEWKEAKA